MRPDVLAIESGAHEAATSPYNQRKPPTEAQAKAGNYKMGRIRLHGMDIAIENPRGTYRSGRNPETGLKWTSRLAAHYGYFPGTMGNDGDPVDCFVGEWVYSDKIYVVNQFFGEKFDEHKVMLGFYDEEAAKIAYQHSFNHGWSCLKSITPCTITQFRWWLKNGNKNKPLYPDHLPHEGTNTMQMIHWTPDANPANIEIGRLLYNMRKDTIPEQGDLLMDSATLADVEAEMAEWADEIITLDAIVVEYKDLTKRLQVMQRAMNRVGELQVSAFDSSKPVTKQGVTHIAAVFSLSDGQSLQIYFHNPDTTPTKINLTDELISWKFLLNKKDITITVAPESGKVMAEVDIAKRMMKLAEKNSEAFQRQADRNTGKAANIEALKTEVASLEKELDTKQKRLQTAKMVVAATPAPETKEAPIETNTDTQTPAPNAAVIPAIAEATTSPDFIPTHELPDGTPVMAHPDEQGVWVDADGDEHETDNVSPISGMDFEQKLKNLKDRRQGTAESPLPEAVSIPVAPEPEVESPSDEEAKDPYDDPQAELVSNALAKYGASLAGDWYIVGKNGKQTGVRVQAKGKRLRFEDANGKLIASGAITEKFVSEFVEKYWYWKKLQDTAFDEKAFDEKTKKLEDAASAVREMLDGIGYTECIALAKELGMKDSYLKRRGSSATAYVLDQHPDDVKKACQDLGYIVAEWEWVDAPLASIPQPVEAQATTNEPEISSLSQKFAELLKSVADSFDDLTDGRVEELVYSALNSLEDDEFEQFIEWLQDGTDRHYDSIIQAEIASEKSDKDPYTPRIEALRTMPREEYDPAIDALIEELQAAGLMDKYEPVLEEIDISRTHELQELVAKVTGGKTMDSAISIDELTKQVRELATTQAEAIRDLVDARINAMIRGD